MENCRLNPRPISFTTNINPYANGSVLAAFGNTKIHITATLENEVPPFLKGSGKGWVTAEYAMLPLSTHSRNYRERKSLSGRSQEIQRLIGRALRASIDRQLLGEISIIVDCDVLVADGGTRTASISGGQVALALAINDLLDKKIISVNPIKQLVAAISVGITRSGEIIADLNYQEDSSSETDMNIVMNEAGDFIEMQGTAEGAPFSRIQLDKMLACAHSALQVVFKEQRKVLGSALHR